MDIFYKKTLPSAAEYNLLRENVGLMASKGLDKFYSKYGFISRPNDYFGPGMTQFWGRNGEMTEE